MENDIQPETNQEFNQDKPSTKTSSNRKAWYAALLVILIAGVVVGVAKIKQSQDAEQSRKEKTASVTGAKKEINPTSEEEAVLKAQLESYKAQVEKLSGSAPTEERYNVYTKLATAQYKLHDYKGAIASLNKIQSENMREHRMWALYTNIYWDMADFPNAREASKKALDLDRENPQSWLAFIELQEDQSKENLSKLYDQALLKTDYYIDVIVAYAHYLEKVGDKPAAISQWEKAIKTVPTKKAEYEAEIERLKK